MDMADQQDRPEPDHTEDPRAKDVGDGGYPEEQPGDASPPARDESGERQGPEADPGDDEATERAPSTSSPSDSEPGAASGNPGAAGGS